MTRHALRNTTDLLVRRVTEAPHHTAFEVSCSDGAWHDVSTVEFDAHVRRVAKGMIAAGLAPGDSVAIMAATRYEWAVADLATWYAGGVVVPIYDTSVAGQVRAVTSDANVRLGIAGSAEQASLLASALTDREACGVWTMDAADGCDLYALEALGVSITDGVLEQRRLLADGNAVATIVYTSGTTDEPKGALITHGNLVDKVLSVASAYTEVVREDGNTIIFLPLAHVLARALQLLCLARGMRVAHISDPRDLLPALAALRPTFLVVVPRVLQKIHAAAGQRAIQRRIGRIWAAAEVTAIAWGRWAEASDAGAATRLGWRLRVRHALFDRVFYRRLRSLMGGRMGYLLSGAAALDADLSLFFRGIGVPVIEGYGLTETTAPLTGNLPGQIASGTVGVPLPGVEIRIDAHGEVLARGAGVFSGYRDAAASASAFTDGWFHTGDLGELDASGRLTLTGRLKDVIVTAGGKNVHPHFWEVRMEAEPLVAHAVMVGEGKPYLGGLIFLDPEQVHEWLEREGLADVDWARPRSDGGITRVREARLEAVLGAVVSTVNAQVAHSERVQRIALLFTDLNANSWLVTPTHKLKRSALVERARTLVDGLYTDAVPPPETARLLSSEGN